MGKVARLTVLALGVVVAVLASAPPVAAAETLGLMERFREPGTLRITEPPSPMTGTVTVPFSYTFTTWPDTGHPPFRFRLHTSSGALPTGLTLNENGLLSGTPTVYGTWIFRVTVFDSISAASSTGQITFNTTVLPMSLGPAPPTVMTALVNHSHQFAAAGGMPPYTYSATGTLPIGMTVNGAGTLVGVPHNTGAFSFTVRATDWLHTSVDLPVTLTVVPPTIVALPPSTPLVIGRAFHHTFTVTPGFIGLATFQRLTGFLPPGVTLSSNGVLSGTPTAAGTYQCVVLARFTVGNPPVATFEDYRQVTLTVVPAPAPSPTPPAVPSTAPQSSPTTAHPTTGTATPNGTATTTPDDATPIGGGGETPAAQTGPDSVDAAALAGWFWLLLVLLIGLALLVPWLLRRRRPAQGPPAG